MRSILTKLNAQSNYIVFLCISIFAIHELLFLTFYKINLFHAEDFFYVEFAYNTIISNEISFPELFSSANEHIVAFMILLVLPYFYFSSFDFANLVYGHWIIMSLSLFFIYLILKKTNRKIFWVLIPISAFIYSPLITHGYYTIPTIQWQITSLGCITIIYLMTANITWKKIFVASIIAICATFTLIPGIITWIIPIIFLVFKNNNSEHYKAKLFVWIGIILLVGIAYYLLAPKIVNTFPNNLISQDGLEYFFGYIASPFRLKFYELLLSAGITTVFATGFFSLYYITKHKNSNVTPWFAFFIVGIVAASISIFGRENLFFESSYRPDYIVFAVLLQIGLLILISLTIKEYTIKAVSNKKLKISFLILVIVLQMILLVPSYYAGYIRAEHYFDQKSWDVGCFSLTHDADCVNDHPNGLLSPYTSAYSKSKLDILNYWLDNKIGLFSNTEINKKNLQDMTEFKNILKIQDVQNNGIGQIEQINNIEYLDDRIVIDEPYVIISGWALTHDKKQFTALYLLVNDEPFLKYADFQTREYVLNLYEIDNVLPGYEISFLSGYLDKGCHELSIIGLKNQNLFKINDFQMCIK